MSDETRQDGAPPTETVEESDAAARKATQAAKWRQRAWTVVFMLLTSFVFTSAVSLTYLSTAETIRTNERLFLQRAVLVAAAIPVPEDAEAVRRLFGTRVREIVDPDGTPRRYDVFDEGGRPAGCVLPISGAGLWGPIDAVVGFDVDCTTLTGLDFTRQNETPGLGGRIAETWFREQFRGKHGPFELVPERTADEGPAQFDAITGATITSTAVRDMLNEICANVHHLVDREGGAGHGNE